MECGWIKEQLGEIDRQEGNTSAKSASDFLASILRERDTFTMISERQLDEGSTFGKEGAEGGSGSGAGAGDVFEGVTLDFGLDLDESSIGGVTVFRQYT
jgi:hypothetical protein